MKSGAPSLSRAFAGQGGILTLGLLAVLLHPFVIRHTAK